MLNENDVVHAVAEELRERGWSIESVALAHQRGPDILARDAVGLWLVEAKGATSSRPGSAAHGRPYGAAEVRINVAEALYTTCVAAKDASYDGAAMALQDDALHRRYTEPLRLALAALDIRVFWVDPKTRNVHLEHFTGEDDD